MLLALLLAVQAPSGLDLQRMCNGEPGSVPHAFCVAYLSGYADGVRAATIHLRQVKRPLACIPLDTTGEDLRGAALTGLRLHPERRQSEINIAALLALTDAWPCPAGKE